MNLELKQEINRNIDWLIIDGKKLADNTKIYLKIEDRKPKEIEESQMRNLLEMATTSDSLKALELFVQYQMGRGKLPRDFGNQLIQKINNELTNKATEISKEHKNEVLLELVRLYIGYLNRYFKFRKGWEP